MSIFPTKATGKWAVVLSAGSLAVLLIFFLSMAMGLTDFDTGHWWDITVAVAAPLELIAFVLSIVALRREKAVLTYCALILGGLAVAFLLTHSLFISD